MAPHILLIDDERAFAEVLAELLAEEGYVTRRVATGEQALELLAMSPSLPGAIICDLMLPGMDGQAVAREVRQRYPAVRLPIVLMSAGTDPRLHLRDVTFLAKPLDIGKLLDVLESLVGVPHALAR